MVQALKSRLDRHFVACSAAAAAASVGVVQQQAEAAIVYSGVVNINIPSTTAGVYVNVVTGVNDPVPGNVPGWDLNPWSSSNLNFFNPAAPAGGVYSRGGATTGVANLPNGYMIDAGNIWTSGSATTNAGWTWNLNSSDNLFGFRFQNEANGNQTHYGWARISLSTSLFAQPRLLVEYAYEDQAGVGIAAGAIPTPGSLALLALGAAGLAGRRRR